MDGLRKLETKRFKTLIEVEFKPESQYRAYFSKTAAHGTLELGTVAQPEDELEREFRNPSTTAECNFQLVVFGRSVSAPARKSTLRISEGFLEFFYDRFKLDPFSKKFLIDNHLDGFHKVAYEPPRADDGEDSRPVTTYIFRSTGLGDLLLWSFDRSSGTTKALLLSSDASTYAPSIQEEDIVEAFSNHLPLSPSPFFPGFALSTHRIQRCEKWCLHVGEKLSKSENLTCHGLWHGHRVQNQNAHIDKISNVSQEMGQLQDHISLEIHHLEPIKAFLHHILGAESENKDVFEGAKLLQTGLFRMQQRLRFWEGTQMAGINHGTLA